MSQSPHAARRRQYLNAMGIEQWVARSSRAPAREQPVAEGRAEPPGRGDTAEALDALSVTVAGCTQCPLHATRTQTVFGVGAPDARCMVIGEAPGADEDRQGEPFVGRAGRLLNAMLRAIGLAREEVYIANIVKCRPPGNRDPKTEEVAACADYLRRQIELVAPALIIAVGRVAAQNLLSTTAPIGKMRGKEFHYPGTGVPVLVTYHPAYLLRSPLEKRKAWEDLRRASRILESSG